MDVKMHHGREAISPDPRKQHPRGNRVSRTTEATAVVESYSYDILDWLVGITSTDGLSATYRHEAFDNLEADEAIYQRTATSAASSTPKLAHRMSDCSPLPSATS